MHLLGIVGMKIFCQSSQAIIFYFRGIKVYNIRAIIKGLAIFFNDSFNMIGL